MAGDERAPPRRVAGLYVTTEWAPGLSLAGGLLIGAAASASLLLAGRITGVSGIFNQLGHGVCGLPRLSKRSLAAVGTFMSTGMAVVYAARHTPLATLLHTDGPSLAALHVPWGGAAATALASAGLAAAVAVNFARHASSREPHELLRSVGTAAAGATFATGLGLSGMTNPDKVLGFLDMAAAVDPLHGWDPSLALVLGGAVGFNLLVFPRVLRRPAPLLAPRFELPTATRVDGELLLGSALFGAGWGLVGVCPGPALVGLSSGALMFWAFTPAMFAGFRLAEATIAATPPTAAPAEGHAQEPPARS